MSRSRKSDSQEALKRCFEYLGLRLEEWEFRWVIGKSVFQGAKQHFRCYAGFRALHRPSGRVFEGGEKGRFTKQQARRRALELFRDQIRAP